MSRATLGEEFCGFMEGGGTQDVVCAKRIGHNIFVLYALAPRSQENFF
jgi:hypothetical protein